MFEMEETGRHLPPFFLEWRIEKFSFWKKAAHGASITCCGSSLVDPNVAIRLTLYPRGESGDGEDMVLTYVGPNKLFREECDLSFLGSDEFLFGKRRAGKVVDGNPNRVVGLKFEKVVSCIYEEVNEYNENFLILRFHCKYPRQHIVSMRTALDVFGTEINIALPNPRIGEHNATIATIVFGVLSQDQNCSSSPSLYLKYNHARKMLNLELTNLKENIWVKCLLKIYDRRSQLVAYTNTKHTFADLLRKFDFSRDIISLDDILTLEQSGYAIFHCIIILGSYGTYCRDLVQSSERSFSSVSLTENLRCLFEDRELSDFHLKCGTESFQVHSSILRARSPVFKAMLSSDMREAVSGSLEIEDMDATSLKLFLEFLYTGRFKDVPYDNAVQLYYAADKYQVPSLSMECAHFLRSNVCISNVCDLLCLGDQHGDDRLTLVAQNFIFKNFKEVSMSKEWQEYMNIDPQLLLKTVNHFAAKGCFDNTNSEKLFDNISL